MYQRHDESALEFAIKSRKRQTRRKVLPKPSIPRSTKQLERLYFTAIKELTDDLRRFTEEMLWPALDASLEGDQAAKPNQPDEIKAKDTVRLDDFTDDIETIVNGMRVRHAEKYTDIEIKNIASKFAERGQDFNSKEINKNFQKVLGVTPFTNEAFLAGEINKFTKTNVKLIKSISQKYFDDIESLIIREAKAGTLAKDVFKKVQVKLKTNIQKNQIKAQNRAKLIARDQISKFNGSLTQARHQNAGIAKYQWQTSLDEAVRDSHISKQGKIFRWDQPPADTGHPGEDIACRCVAIPVFED